MSRIKRQLEEHEALMGIAAEILLETGAVEKCDMHEDVLIDQFDEDAQKRAYAIATNRIKSGEIDADRADLMDAIKVVISDSGDECYSCERQRLD